MSALADTSFHSARELLTSQIITLEASDSNTPFQVHEHLLHSLSPILLAAFSGEWKETALKHYKFQEDVPEEVLMCFLTWAYCREYDNGNVKHSEAQSSNKTTKKEKKRKSVLTWMEQAQQSGERQLEEKSKPNPDQEIEWTVEKSSTAPASKFKLHPRLLDMNVYVFAETYMIEPLKTLSRQKLIDQLNETSLKSLQMDDEREAIFDVLKYAFSSRLPEEDMLLHWLGCYASWRLDELTQFPSSFGELLSETEGNFAKILIKYVRKSEFSPFDIKFGDVVRYPVMVGKYSGNPDFDE